MPQRDPFLLQLKKAETDPALAREMFMHSMGLRYDFTQHYKKQ